MPTRIGIKILMFNGFVEEGWDLRPRRHLRFFQSSVSWLVVWSVSELFPGRGQGGNSLPWPACLCSTKILKHRSVSWNATMFFPSQVSFACERGCRVRCWIILTGGNCMCSATPLFCTSLLPFTLAEAKHSFCTAILVRRSSSSIQVTHKLFINECVSHTPELSISASWMFFIFFQTPTVFDAWVFLLSTKV